MPEMLLEVMRKESMSRRESISPGVSAGEERFGLVHLNMILQ